MYCEFYQLSERPFNVTPDPKFLYLNARYREAIASLNYGITQRKGFITLIGEAGTGKTTLLNKLLEDLDPKTKSVFIFNTNVTFEEILEYIFAEFDLPVHNGKKLYMLQRLNAFLLEELRAGVNVALLIDEAQDLEFSVLEDLRLLSNLETAKEKILQIVLSGQPELGQKLSNPILRQLRQRIGINSRLLPLSRDEITEYIQYRLQAAGCPDLKLFSREAEEQIYHFSRGIPRLVNVVCDNALVIGYALGKRRIGADVITEAAADLLSVEPAGEPSAGEPIPAAPVPPVSALTPRRARFGVMGLVLLAITVGLFSMGRSMLHSRAEEPVSITSEAPKLEVIRPGSQPQGTGVEVPAGRPAERAADAGSGGNEGAEEAAPPPAHAAPEPAAVVAAAPPSAADAGSDPFASAPATLGNRERAMPVDEPATGALPPRARNEAADASTGAMKALRREAAAVPGAAAAPIPPKETDLPKPAPAQEGKVHETQVAAVEPDDGGEEPTAPPHDEGSHGLRLEGVPFAQVTVRGGDSMSGIALRKYGQASHTILDLLKLANPELRDINLITVGQTIRLPELSEGFPILNDGSGRYELLVFSTPQALRAAALQNALRSHGFDAHVSGANAGLSKPIFRVVLSGYSDRDEIASVGKQLQKLFREDTRIAQLGE